MWLKVKITADERYVKMSLKCMMLRITVAFTSLYVRVCIYRMVHNLWT